MHDYKTIQPAHARNRGLFQFELTDRIRGHAHSLI